MTRLGPLLALLCLALAGCGGGGGDGDGGDGGDRPTATTRVEVVQEGDGDGGPSSAFDPRRVYERDSPGVVTVFSLFGGGSLQDLLRSPGGGGGGAGTGTGFVISGEGEIVTNAHVVLDGEAPDFRRPSEVYVQFADGNRVRARVLGEDPYSDIALLKVDPAGLTLRPLELGTSDGVEVGSPVAAIGSPFGEEQSLTTGIVSAVDRSVTSLTNFQIAGAIQTDAAINPGNSGGPLVDADGSVIGVNQQIATRGGGGEGVGFAVPVDTVKRSISQLREDGDVDYSFLGISSTDLYPQLVDRYKLPVEKGVWVQTVSGGGPADEAGVTAGRKEEVFQAQPVFVGGDVITKVAGREVTSGNQLAEAIADKRPGETVDVELYRGKERRTVKVRLGERPLQPARSG